MFYGTKSERALLIGNAVPPKLAENVARSLIRDLHTEKEEKAGGALLSFETGLSSGVSPVLRRVMDMVEDRFRLNLDQPELF